MILSLQWRGVNRVNVVVMIRDRVMMHSRGLMGVSVVVMKRDHVNVMCSRHYENVLGRKSMDKLFFTMVGGVLFDACVGFLKLIYFSIFFLEGKKLTLSNFVQK